MLFIRSNPKFELLFQKKGIMSEVDVEAMDVYFNLVSVITQLIKGKMPWRGGREKDFESIQVLIETLITLYYVVVDAHILHVDYFSRFLSPMILIMDKLMICTRNWISSCLLASVSIYA